MRPTSAYERQYLLRGYHCIAGLDEVGRGCLAGPVVAAAVILDLDSIPRGIDDSKRLSADHRERLDRQIRASALAFGIGVGEVEEIDRINILEASKLAMLRAIDALEFRPDLLIIDGNQRLNSELDQVLLIKGDQKSVSVAAASIVAKVHRDALMREMDARFPGYGFASHKGYGSKTHRESMQALGLSPIHRKSFQWTPV